MTRFYVDVEIEATLTTEVWVEAEDEAEAGRLALAATRLHVSPDGSTPRDWGVAATVGRARVMGVRRAGP